MPYALVAAAILWPNAVRLCRAFREVGFEVGAIAVPQHPVHRSKAPHRTYEYRPKAPLDSLREAIAERRPDIIVPCDDRIVGHLCSLRALGDDDTSTLIETSLGLGGASGVLANRATLGEMSRLPDVDVPRTNSIVSVSDLQAWGRKFGLPAVLKLDGSWGGNDIVVVRREFRNPRSLLADEVSPKPPPQPQALRNQARRRSSEPPEVGYQRPILRTWKTGERDRRVLAR